MKILDLLLKMRSERIHMSIVVDEFGGTNGLVTIEDLVEEIVGEIKDEHDMEQIDEIKKLSKKRYEVSARTSIEEFEKKLGVDLKFDEKDEIDTLGGFIFSFLGRIPGRGEVINYDKFLEFTILEADTRRIKKISVSFKKMKKDNLFYFFFFFGICLGISQSFVWLIPIVFISYFFLIIQTFKENQFSRSFTKGWVFGIGFFLSSMHWIVSPFLIYERHLFLSPISLLFPIFMGLFFQSLLY